VKFRQDPNLCRKVESVQIFLIQQPGHFLIALTRKSLTVWSRIMNHQKVVSVMYQNGIRKSGNFRLVKSSEFCFLQLLCCPEQVSKVLPMHKIP
jgi:hypothetical protein